MVIESATLALEVESELIVGRIVKLKLFEVWESDLVTTILPVAFELVGTVTSIEVSDQETIVAVALFTVTVDVVVSK